MSATRDLPPLVSEVFSTDNSSIYRTDLCNKCVIQNTSKQYYLRFPLSVEFQHYVEFQIKRPWDRSKAARRPAATITTSVMKLDT